MFTANIACSWLRYNELTLHILDLCYNTFTLRILDRSWGGRPQRQRLHRGRHPQSRQRGRRGLWAGQGGVNRRPRHAPQRRGLSDPCRQTQALLCTGSLLILYLLIELSLVLYFSLLLLLC